MNRLLLTIAWMSLAGISGCALSADYREAGVVAGVAAIVGCFLAERCRS